MAQKFNIRISIDGKDAAKQAGKVRAAIEQELGQITISTSLDTRTANAIKRMFDASGDAAPNLERAAAALRSLSEVDAGSLQEVHKALLAIKQDAAGIGKAMADGMQQNWGSLNQTLAAIQSQVTGIVRPGDKKGFAATMLEDMPELEAALGENDKKAFELAEKMRALRTDSDKAAEAIAELKKTVVFPTGGGDASTLERLFYGFDSSYMRGKVRAAIRAIDAELAPLEAEIDARMAESEAKMQSDLDEIRAAREAVGREIDRLSQEQPAAPTATPYETYIDPRTGEERTRQLEAVMSEERRAWEEQMSQTQAQYLELDKRLSDARSQFITGDAAELRDKLMWRRRELEKPLQEDFEFWREWSAGSVEETAQMLRSSGQSAAADAISQLDQLTQDYKRHQSNMKRTFGAMRKGGTAELDADAQGTLVDFITAERALEEAVKETTPAIESQAKALGKLISAMDDAARAAAGMGETERKGASQLESAAQREIRQRTKASVPLEEAAENTRDVLDRLATEIASLHAAANRPAEQAATALEASAQTVAEATRDIETELARDVTEPAQQHTKGILGAWEWLYDKLIGHSVIPDMIEGINAAWSDLDFHPLMNEFNKVSVDLERVSHSLVNDSQRMLAGIVQSTGAQPLQTSMLQEHTSAWWMRNTETAVLPANELRDLARQTEQQVAEASRYDDAVSNTQTAARAVLDAWAKTSDELVGHSIIPDMVKAINAWLARIDTDRFGTEYLVANADATAQAVSTALGDIQLPVEVISAQAAVIADEIARLEQAAEQTMLMGGEGPSRRYIAKWEAVKETIRKQRAVTPEDEAMLAQGYIPRGYSVHSPHESIFDRGGEELREYEAKRGHTVSESDDQWYRVIDTERLAQTRQRFTAEQKAILDEASEKMPLLEAQYAALADALHTTLIGAQTELQEYVAAAPDVAQEGEAYFDHLQEQVSAASRAIETLAGRYTDLGQTQQALAEADVMHESSVQQEAASYTASPEGRAAAAEAARQRKAEIDVLRQAEISAIRATEKEQAEAERRKTLATRAETTERQQLARADANLKTQEAKASKTSVVEAEKRKTIVARAETAERQQLARAEANTKTSQAKASTASVIEAERRHTAEKKAQLAIDAAAEKSRLRLAEQNAKLLIEAQKLTGELGMDWMTVEAGMLGTGQTAAELVGVLKAQKVELVAQQKAQAASARTAQQRLGQEQRAQELAAQIGVSWDDVEQAMSDTGMSLEDVIRQLQTLERRQSAVNTHANRLREDYQGILGTVKLFTEELNAAGKESEGMTLIARNLESVANNLGRTSVAIQGSLMVAGRDYVNFIKQADVAARAVGLDRNLTESLRQQTIAQATDIGIDPQEIARGLTIWAQDAGVAIETQAELNQMMEEAIPIQRAAILSSTDLATMTSATAAAINQYGISAHETTRIVAVFNKVANDTLVDVGDVAQSFKMVGPMAQRAGEELEQTAVILSVLGDNGIRGTQAGTSYARMLNNLLVPSAGKAQKTLEELFGTADAFYDSGTFVGSAKAIEMLAEATRDMSDQQRETTLDALFDHNAARAAAVLIREQTEAGARGINILQRESSTLRERALQEWEIQSQQLEDSEAQRIARMQQEWKALWLTIGQQGMEAVLPIVEEASEVIGQVAEFVRANPEIVRSLAVVAGSGIVLSRMLAATSTAINTITLASNLAKSAWGVLTFKSAVVTSGELFRASVIQAAAVQTGAAKTAAATHVASTAKVNAMMAAAWGTKTTALATAVTGLKAGVALLAKAVLGPLAAIVGGALIYDQIRGEDSASLAEMSAVAAYAAGDIIEKLFGGREGLADDWFVAQAQRAGLSSRQEPAYDAALAERGIYMPGMEMKGAGTALERLTGTIRDGVAAFQALGAATESAADDIWRPGDAINQLRTLTDEQQRAAELYIDLLERQKDAVEDFNKKLAAAVADLERDMADLDRKYRDERAKTAEEYEKDITERQRQHHQRRAQAEADHRKRMARMEEDHLMRMWDFSLSRDAAGMYKEKQNHAKEKSRAEEDYRDSQQQTDVQFTQEQQRRQEQHAERMLDLQTRYNEERASRQEQHAERVAELQQQHAEDMERLRKEYFDKINAELKFYEDGGTLQSAYHAAMLADAEAFLRANRSIWANHIANLPAPTARTPYTYTGGSTARANALAGSGVPGYASGGYVPNTGLAMLHAGEFVMSPRTTRQVEASMGNRLTQQSMARAGGVQINATFTGMGPQDRGWYEAKLQEFQRELAQAIQ